MRRFLWGEERILFHSGGKSVMLTVVAKDEERTKLRGIQFYCYQGDCGSLFQKYYEGVRGK